MTLRLATHPTHWVRRRVVPGLELRGVPGQGSLVSSAAIPLEIPGTVNFYSIN